MTDRLSEENQRVWNRFGLIAMNGSVTVSMSVFGRLLDAAREEGRQEIIARIKESADAIAGWEDGEPVAVPQTLIGASHD